MYHFKHIQVDSRNKHLKMELLDQSVLKCTNSIDTAKSSSMEFLYPSALPGQNLLYASLCQMCQYWGVWMDNASFGVLSSFTASQPKERPRSAVLLADETTAAPMFTNRRSQQSVSLSKSVSIQNIAG